MSQPMSVNDVMEITIEGTNEQQTWALVRHYLVSQITTADLWIAALKTFWVNTLIPEWEVLTTTLWVAECMTIGRVAPQSRQLHFDNFVPAVVGDITSDGLPPQNAVLIRHTTDEPGASNRGRSYLTGCPEASTNGGVLLASVQGPWQTLADRFSEVITDGGEICTPVVFSRTLYDDEAVPPQAVTVYTSPITGSDLQGNIATQRRRRTQRSSFSS